MNKVSESCNPSFLKAVYCCYVALCDTALLVHGKSLRHIKVGVRGASSTEALALKGLEPR